MKSESLPIPEKSSVGLKQAHECPFGCHHNINELQAYRVELEAALKIAGEALEFSEKAHKKLEGEIFCLCQPDKGDVFSAFDSIGFNLRTVISLIQKTLSRDLPN